MPEPVLATGADVAISAAAAILLRSVISTFRPAAPFAVDDDVVVALGGRARDREIDAVDGLRPRLRIRIDDGVRAVGFARYHMKLLPSYFRL